jgi:Uncharacterised nucleotidyltransferase
MRWPSNKSSSAGEEADMSQAEAMPRTAYHRPVWPAGPWPDDTQLLLLRACLLEDRAAASKAWEAWRRRVVIDELDAGSQRLLPLLYGHLSGAGVHPQDYERIKGVARYSWVRYQQQLYSLCGVLTSLAKEGIETMLLKGAALNLTNYAPGTRPMADLDVVVPRPAARRAMQVLRDNGWTSSSADPERLVQAVHACEFAAPGGRFVDLHWDFFHGRVLSAREQALFWTASEVVDAAGARTRVLAPTHQLVHTCVHGARACDAPPLRWLADACWIVRRQANRIDWGEVVQLAGQHELSPYVHTTLAFLAEHLGVAIPPKTLDALRRARTSPSARLQFYFASRTLPGVDPFWNTLPFHLVSYWRERRPGRRFRLAEHLRLQHHYEQPLAHYLGQLCALQLAGGVQWLKNLGRRLWRRVWCAAPEHSIDMGADQRWRLEHFHELEMSRRRLRLFRWSNPSASIILTGLEPASYRVDVTLAPFRAWEADLSSHLSILFNGHVIPPHQVAFQRGRLSFALAPNQFERGERQKLTFRCRPLLKRNADQRELGIPICCIRICPLAAPHGEQAA